MINRERIQHARYPTRDAAKADVFKYIERFHNPRMRRRAARQDWKVSAFLNRP
jgi:putative transposase